MDLDKKVQSLAEDYSDKSKQTSCNLPLVALHHFCLTKGFQKTPDYSAIYRSERNLTVFYIAQIMPSFVVLCMYVFHC